MRMYFGMNTALLHSIPFAFLLLWQAAACCLLMLWLWRHRRVKVPFYRRARVKAADPAFIARHPRAKPEWVRKKVLYLASHLDSCRQVAHVFNRSQGCWAHVGKTLAWEVMRDNADEIHQLRRERKRRKPQLIAVNHTWALDLTFYRSPCGVTFTVLGIIDAGSRRLLMLQVLPAKCAFAILGYLFLAFSRYGLPCVIRTDNEAMFTSKVWLQTLQALGILLRRGPPCQPWHNGRIERLFGTLKQSLRRLQLDTACAVQAALNEFNAFYNQVRPHQALAGLTPQEAWQGKTLAEVQEGHATADGEWLQALGGHLVGYHLRR